MKIRFPFWLKILTVGVLLSVPPVTFLGIFALNQNAEVIKADNRDLRLAISEDIANVIELTVQDAQTGVLGIGAALSDGQLPGEQRMAVARLLVGSSKVLDHAIIYAPDGSFIDAIEPKTNEYKPAADPLADDIRKEAATDGVAYTTVAAGDKQRLQIVIPIKVDEEVTGFVGSFVPLTAVQERIEFAAQRLPDSPDPIWVTTTDGTIVAHLAPGRIGETFDHPLLADAELTRERGVAQSGEVGPEQARMLASVKPLPTLPWMVGVQVPVADAYASYYEMRQAVIGTVIGLIVLAILLSLFLARAITRPVSRLVEFTKTLAARNFDAKTGVTSRDEFGVLSEALEGAARDLDASEKQIKQEIEIRSDLRRFLPDHLVEGIVAREASLELGGQRRAITVMFADVVSFTRVCEEQRPEDVVAILNELFTILTEIVFRHGGTVDKFVGDSVMAFWGAPEACEDHAVKALDAAEDMMRWIEISNDRWKESFGVNVELAIGVHSGEAVIGNIGSSTRMEYTAIGSTVNIAARLEALARPNQILSTNATRDEVEDAFSFARLREEKITSGRETIEVFEVAI